MPFNREARYVVVKLKDIRGAGCTQEEIDAFNALCDKVTRHRYGRGAGPLEGVVVEKDWPEYEPTWDAIKTRMESPGKLARDCHNCRDNACSWRARKAEGVHCVMWEPV